MAEFKLNNGVKFSDYEDPISLADSAKDEAFYASMLVDSDSKDPIEYYNRIKEEQKQTGYSVILEQAKLKWKEEQDFSTRETIQGIIEDPTLDKAFKSEILKNYINNNQISNDLKDKVIFNLTNNYITENGFDNNPEAIDQVDLVVDKLKYEQYLESYLDNSIQKTGNMELVTTDEAVEKALTVAQKLEQGIDLENPAANYGLAAEWVWFQDMLIGKSPNYFQTFFQTLASKFNTPQGILGKEILKRLFTSEQLVNAGINAGYETRTLTEIRKEITERNEQSWTAEWRDSVADSLNEMGYSQELIQKTLLGRTFESLGKAFEYLGNTFNSDDPQSIIMPLETLLFGLPLIGRGQQIGKQTKTPSTSKDKTKKEREAAADAVRAENKRQAEMSATKTSKVKASATVNVKSNSPIVTVTQSNKKAGSDMVQAIIEDNTGRLGEASGFTRSKLQHYLTDPNSNIIKSKQFGFSTDISRLTQMEMQAARDRQILIENPNLADAPQVIELLDDVVLTLNGVIPEVPMIVSNTFATLRRTPTGIALSIPFMKNPGEFYKSQEIIPAYEQALESIKENFVDSEGAVKPGELIIQELDNINNVINDFTPETIPATLNPTSDYIVRWQPEGDIYDTFYKSFGVLPSDRFNTKTLTDKAKRYIYDSEVSASSTGTINQLFTYGRYDKALEKRVYQDQLNRNAYFKEQEKQLELALKKNLTNKEQNELGKLLIYQDKYGFNQLTPKQIADTLGYVPEYKVLTKLQEALGVYRYFENSKYQADNVTYGNLLNEAGYNNSFYIELEGAKNIKTTEVMPVKDTFLVEPKDPIAFTETGEVLSYEIWDFSNKKAILWQPETGFEKTHYVIGENNMPNQQVYRLARNYVDPITGDIFQYGAFGTLKAQPLPNDILPRRPGHVTKMHTETYTIVAIPLQFKINGKLIDYTKGEFSKLGNKRILDLVGDLVSKDMKETRALVLNRLRPFGKVVAMRNSKAKAYKWSRENISGNPNTLYILEKAKELNLNEVADYRVREVQAVQGQRLRNETLDYEISVDPYETAIRTGTSIGQLAYGQIGLNQLKKEWLTTYLNNPQLTIAPNPRSNKDMSMLDMESQMQAKQDFPLQANQIKENSSEYAELGRQARADWQLINTKELSSAAWDTKKAILTLRKLSNDVGNITENNKFTSWMAKGARSIQRNPQEASGSLLRTVTTFQLMINLPKQLFLQGMAPLSGLLTVSKNPIQFIENVYYAIGIATRQFAQSSALKKGKLDLDRMHDYMFEQSNLAKNQIEGFDLPLKLSGKDFDLLVAKMKETNFSRTGDHILTHGLGLNSIAQLGQSKGPINWLLESLAEYGFELGELLSRDGHVIVALRNWIDNNPGKNWRTDKALDQIMFDAYQLSGSMTNVTKMAWQSSISLRTVGQFQSFLMRMNEAAINPSATPFNNKQRYKNIAYHYALYGSVAFGLHQMIIEGLEESGNPHSYEVAQFLKFTNFFYIAGNTIGDYIFGSEEQQRKSESVFGDVFGLYGDLEQFAGPWSSISALVMGILNDDVDERNVGATIAWLKKSYGISQDIAEIWIRNPEAYKDEALLKSLITIADILPPVRGGINIKQELDAKMKRASATGHDYGLDFTLSELVFQNMWGVQTRKNSILWKPAMSEAERSKALDAHAKRFLKIISSTSEGGMPDYYTVSKALVAYKLILENKGFIVGTAAHNEFMNKVMTMMGRQKTPVAENFIKKYFKRLMISKELSNKEILRIRQSIEVAPGFSDEERQSLMNMLNSHIETQSKEGN